MNSCWSQSPSMSVKPNRRSPGGQAPPRRSVSRLVISWAAVLSKTRTSEIASWTTVRSGELRLAAARPFATYPRCGTTSPADVQASTGQSYASPMPRASASRS
jgi:hypothetical protein